MQDKYWQNAITHSRVTHLGRFKDRKVAVTFSNREILFTLTAASRMRGGPRPKMSLRSGLNCNKTKTQTEWTKCEDTLMCACITVTTDFAVLFLCYFKSVCMHGWMGEQISRSSWMWNKCFQHLLKYKEITVIQLTAEWPPLAFPF